jgi:S1-C subfamily serine protease
MYAEAVARISESIFPIFFVRLDGDASFIGVAGTGFFVDDRGLFVTAEHTVADASAGSRLYYYGNVPEGVCEPVEIECVATDPARDLYLGRVARDHTTPVAMATEAVRSGDAVCLAGYPMAVPWLPDRGLAGNVRRYLQPTFVIDEAEVVIGHRTYEGYIVQHACLRGMSGGPVFDPRGRVRGMAAATLTRTVPDPGGSPTVLQNGVVVGVEHIRRFVEASCGSSRRAVVAYEITAARPAQPT